MWPNRLAQSHHVPSHSGAFFEHSVRRAGRQRPGRARAAALIAQHPMAPTRRSQKKESVPEQSPPLAPGSPPLAQGGPTLAQGGPTPAPDSRAAGAGNDENQGPVLSTPPDGLPEWAASALGDPIPEDDPMYCRLRYMQHALMTVTRVRLQARAEEQASQALSTLAAKHMQELSDHAACISRSLQRAP